MDKLKDLLAGRAAAIEAADSLTEISDRDLTAEEEADFDRLAGEIKALDAKIARASVVANARASTPIVLPQTPMVNPGAIAPDSPAAAGPQPRTEFESLGEFIATIAINRDDQRLAGLWHSKLGAATTQSTTSSRGGYAIPPAFIDTLLQVGPASEMIRPRATILPSEDAPDQTVHIPALDQSDHGESPTVNKVYGGVQVSWISEGAEKPQTDFKLREVTLTPYEVAASLDVNDRLLANWRSCGMVIENLLRGAMIATHDDNFLNGDGSSKPTGIIGHASTVSVTRQSAGTVTYQDTCGMVDSFLEREGSPVWIISRSAMPKLRNMKDDDGRLIWQPDARSGEPQTLHGFPIIKSVRSPLLGTAGDVVLADLSKYLIKNGSGPFIGSSEHVRYRENVTVYKCFWNVDGKPWLTQPFMDEDDREYSPFVRLV